MEILGSPTAHQRAPPLLLFVLDIPSGSTALHVSRLEWTVVRQLLYFHMHVDKRLTWAYQLFSSSHSASSTISPQKMPTEFTPASLIALHDALLSYVSQSNDFTKGTLITESPLRITCSALERAMQDMKWDWNSHVARISGALLSPPQLMKVSSGLKHGSFNFKIRNYLYLISEIPGSMDLMYPFTYAKELPKTHGSGAQRARCLSECMQDILEDIYGTPRNLSRLWSTMIEKRTSLSILDVCADIPNAETHQIHTRLHSLLHLTGGGFMPGYMSSMSIQCASFFSMYRGKKVVATRPPSNRIKSFNFEDYTSKIGQARLCFLGAETSVSILTRPGSLLSEDKDTSPTYGPEVTQKISKIHAIQCLSLGLLNIDCDWIDSSLGQWLIVKNEAFKILDDMNASSVLLVECVLDSGMPECVISLAIIQRFAFDSYRLLLLKSQYHDAAKDLLPMADHDTNIFQFSLTEWVAEIQRAELSKFIFEGDIASISSPKEFHQKSLGLWEPELSERCQALPEPESNVNIFDVQAVDTNPSAVTQIQMPTFLNSEDALAAMSRAYIDLLYNFKENLATFLSDTLPPVYACLGDTLEDSLDPVEVMVNYVASNLIHNISDIDRKAECLLNYSVDDSSDAFISCQLSEHERNVLQVWLDDCKALTKDKKAWKDAVHLFKSRSAKLQIILLLECLRLEAETDVSLPRLRFQDPVTKNKGKKRVKQASSTKDAYKQLVMDYIDRICIWNALATTNGSNTFSTFVEPILQNYYEASLSELIGRIMAKFEPENRQHEVLESPVFKKKRISKRKESVSKSIKTLKEGLESETSKTRSSIWEKLSKRALPLRKGKSQKDWNKSRPLPGTQNSKSLLKEVDRKTMRGLETKATEIPERILVMATPQKPKSSVNLFVLKS